MAAEQNRPRRVLETIRQASADKDLPFGRSHKVLLAAVEGWARDTLGDRRRAAELFRRARRGLRRGVDPGVPGCACTPIRAMSPVDAQRIATWR